MKLNQFQLINLHFKKLYFIGKSMKYFYLLYDSYELENLMSFTFGFHGYIDTILGINKQLKNKKLNPMKFTKSNKFKLKNMYYPNLKNPVKNNIDISKNHIITGPNAAGKTTLIKSSIINLLISQQIGLGYFDKGTSGTFKHIHCYLNIPDSCSRDSLFQAEARRCKNIIDKFHSILMIDIFVFLMNYILEQIHMKQLVAHIVI